MHKCIQFNTPEVHKILKVYLDKKKTQGEDTKLLKNHNTMAKIKNG